MQCYRHPDRETRVSCSRCDRPICGDCMTPTSVGMRCPECSGEKTQVRKPQFTGGGTAATGLSRAPATFTLIGINVAIFVMQLATGGGGFDVGGSLVGDGALCGSAVGPGGICGPPLIETAGGEWWRIITAGFLHGSIIHLALNMFVLYILGTMLEPAIGSPRTVAIYFVALVAGSAGALLLAEPVQNTVGASGAIYGLFAAALLIARDRGMTEVVTQLGFWLVLNLVLTFSVSGISIGGHLGGLVGGAIAGLVVLMGERRAESQKIIASELVALIALTVGFFAAGVLIAGAGG